MFEGGNVTNFRLQDLTEVVIFFIAKVFSWKVQFPPKHHKKNKKTQLVTTSTGFC